MQKLTCPKFFARPHSNTFHQVIFSTGKAKALIFFSQSNAASKVYPNSHQRNNCLFMVCFGTYLRSSSLVFSSVSLWKWKWKIGQLRVGQIFNSKYTFRSNKWVGYKCSYIVFRCVSSPKSSTSQEASQAPEQFLLYLPELF